MSNFTMEQKQKMNNSLKHHIILCIKDGLRKRLSKEEIRNKMIHSLNIEKADEMEFNKFRTESRIDNIFEGIWEDYFNYD